MKIRKISMNVLDNNNKTVARLMGIMAAGVISAGIMSADISTASAADANNSPNVCNCGQCCQLPPQPPGNPPCPPPEELNYYRGPGHMGMPGHDWHNTGINKDDATNFYKDAVESYDNGNYRMAYFKACRAIDNYWDYADAYLLRAKASFDMNNYYEAMRDVEIYMGLTSEPSAEAYNLRSVLKHELGQPLYSALLDAGRAIQLDSTKYLYYRNKARIELEMGNYISATRDYEKALELAPESEQRWINQEKLEVRAR